MSMGPDDFGGSDYPYPIGGTRLTTEEMEHYKLLRDMRRWRFYCKCGRTWVKEYKVWDTPTAPHAPCPKCNADCKGGM